MTLLEAIESGKPFKRERWTDSSWIKIQKDVLGSLYFPSTGHGFQITVDDLKGEDYVVRDESKGERAVRELNEAIKDLSDEELYFMIKDIEIENPEKYASLEKFILGAKK